ncbi:MAG: helix-turn-helix transcriptional regulator [Chitinophagaceae bacterium]|nr:helix-turn-helix transcriptional regulator [Chitinophagaceae bacterium]
MNKILYKFNNLDSEEFFRELSEKIGTVSNPHTLIVNPILGNGVIHRRIVAEKIVLLTWDVTIKRPIIFIKDAFPDYALRPSLILLYPMNKEQILLRNPQSNEKFWLKGHQNSILITNNSELQAEISPDVKLKLLLLTVPFDWLRQEYADAEQEMKNFLGKLIDKQAPTLFLTATSNVESRLVNEMTLDTYPGDHSKLYYKSRVFSLLVDFLHKVHFHSAKDITESRILHYEKMREVEEILKEHLEKTLPDINTIAKQMAMSVSTLKRHFKQIYDKSIYDHYLEMKMDLARKLLTEKPLSVNEVATILDYEKTSSFINMFKKHHGISPGSVKRKSA